MNNIINKTISVIGLGYIGLPTASILATVGFNVLGIDTNPSVVKSIKNKTVYIEEPGVFTLFQSAVNSGRLDVFSIQQPADIYIIAVPTPVNNHKQPKLDSLTTALQNVSKLLKEGDLVIIESTIPPLTTKEIAIPILEKSGLKGGIDFFLSYCPERILPGKIVQELIQNNRVIGGITSQCSSRAREIYATFVEGDIFETSIEIAEMTKLAENTFRDVNIALANELADICSDIGVNFWDVRALANQHPRVHLHKTGSGVGGHCIPVDPWFIVDKSPNKSPLIQQARLINDSVPEKIVNILIKELEDIKNPLITILGLTYKPDIADTRNAPTEKVINLLEKKGFNNIQLYDPYVKYSFLPLSTLENVFLKSDCILLMVNHSCFNTINPQQVAKKVKNKLFIDTQNINNKSEWEKAGFGYILIGT